MYMIVVVHILNHGGVFGHEKSGAANILDTFIAALVYSCVNCYALISGFVGYRENKHNHKFTSLITIWFQVVLYGVLLTILFKFTGWADVGLKQCVLPPLAVCGSALVILIVCLLIDRIRIALFNVLRIKELSAKIDSLIHKVKEFILRKTGVSEE